MSITFTRNASPKSFTRSHRTTVASIAAGAVLVSVGGAYAVDQRVATRDGQVNACINLQTKALRLETPQVPCNTSGPRAKREREISWNREGQPGAAGLKGDTGTPGARGPAGADGPTGAKGDTGAAGAKGDTGPAGVAGPKGDTGVAGAPGATGAKGDTGAVGPSGPKGDTGADGVAGPKGDTGAAGAAGATGPAGTSGPKGDTGATGAAGAKGDTGAQGPAGPTGPAGAAGGGTVLKDGNGVTLGKVISSTNRAVTVLTSGNYFVTISWDGRIPNAQAYYTGGGCTGAAYLNSGQGANGPAQVLYARTLVYLGSAQSLAIPDTTAANGSVTSVKINQTGIDNPTCSSNPSTVDGWALKNTTAGATGLPAAAGTGQLAAPLSFG